MEQPLTYLQKRAGEDWLIGYNSHQFHCLTEELYQQLTQLSQGETPPKIVLAEQHPLQFLAAFLAAVAANCPVFLCNPHWVEREWQQVLDLVQPNLILGVNKGEDSSTKRLSQARVCLQSQKSDVGAKHLGDNSLMKPKVYSPNASPSGSLKTLKNQDSTELIYIPTGGSSGKIRFTVHRWQTLMASVAGFHQYFEQKQINSFCVLPLYHVSGLMQFLRSLVTGGRIVIMPFKALTESKRQEAGGTRQKAGGFSLEALFEPSSLTVDEECNINPREFFLSLVPTQLARLMNLNASAWLSGFRTVLLGGAPPWNSLLEQARLHNIPLAPTYGMTETASGVVTLKPEVFLSGNNSSGQILPHAQVTIRTTTGEILEANQTGMITIQADSLALGYYPELEALNRKSPIPNFLADDLGFFDEQGYLHIIGRYSNKIITGGENVFPAEVESAIQATKLVTDVCVIGVPDSDWGEMVTAIYVPNFPTVSHHLIEIAIEDKLSKYKRPKRWISVANLPRNAQGKVNYEQLQEMVNGCLTI
ncbi:MAG: 2-succinylbenzoate--CoA ligase [Symploca sp. SIO2C1]|nr:2-succinylbenzoate--CoA ligase [Symploca sp. SIO2C1]